MSMDKKKLNAAYDTLTETVGEAGAFIILCSSLEGGVEDIQILSGGSLVRNLGALPLAQDQLMLKLKEMMKSHPPPA